MPEIKESKTKTLLVTSALPYANGELHLGHISSTYLPADIYTRYSRLKGRPIYHICASDDFGTPVLIKAEKVGKSPRDYVAFWHKRDLDDFKSIGISFDVFSKTSSEENIKFVQKVFMQLLENGYIYEQDVIQFFCEYDKKFLPDRYVIGTCPYCQAADQYSDLCEKCGRVPEEILNPKCAICGRPPVKRKSKHYFFKLSNFSDRLKEWLVGNKNLQDDVKNYVLNWINDGLQDWDITRDLEWGVPIPLDDAKGKVFYGWFDNHLCYISSSLTLFEKLSIDGKRYWNESEIIHFIGKDIIYHHFLFLPAMRLGIGEDFKLPDLIPTRGHLLLQNQKISKSRNWYIGLRDFVTLFNPDYLRFYVASITPFSQDDINFELNGFGHKINDELIANLGNFINRALSFVARAFGGIVPTPGEYDNDDRFMIGRVHAIPFEVGSLLDKIEIDRALKKILHFGSEANSYFQKKAPWADKNTSSTTIYISVNIVRTLAIMVAPYIPFSAEKIWNQLALDGNVHKQSWDNSSEIIINPGHKIGRIEPIFQRIEGKELEMQKAKLIHHS